MWTSKEPGGFYLREVIRLTHELVGYLLGDGNILGSQPGCLGFLFVLLGLFLPGIRIAQHLEFRRELFDQLVVVGFDGLGDREAQLNDAVDDVANLLSTSRHLGHLLLEEFAVSDTILVGALGPQVEKILIQDSLQLWTKPRSQPDEELVPVFVGFGKNARVELTFRSYQVSVLIFCVPLARDRIERDGYTVPLNVIDGVAVGYSSSGFRHMYFPFVLVSVLVGCMEDEVNYRTDFIVKPAANSVIVLALSQKGNGTQ